MGPFLPQCGGGFVQGRRSWVRRQAEPDRKPYCVYCINILCMLFSSYFERLRFPRLKRKHNAYFMLYALTSWKAGIHQQRLGLLHPPVSVDNFLVPVGYHVLVILAFSSRRSGSGSLKEGSSCGTESHLYRRNWQ